MDVSEFREFLRDRISNACGDPMGFEATVEEIMDRLRREMDAAFQRGVDAGVSGEGIPSWKREGVDRG